MSRFKILALNSVVTLTLLGCASAGHHYYDSAVNDLNRAPASMGVPDSFDINSTNTVDSVHSQAQADYLFLKSEMESNAGRGTETIELLKTALIYDAESSTLMQKLAIEYYKIGNLNTALQWAERAYEAQPGKRDLALLLAGLHTSNKDYVKAEEIYKKLVKQDKDDAEAVLYLGAVYTELKNYHKAVITFKNLTMNKNYSSKHLAHYYLARVYSEQNAKNSVQVKEQLRKAISIKPDFSEAITMLGQYIQREQGAEKAFKFYESLQKEHGPNIKLAEILAQFYIGKNQFDKAYEQLEIVDEASDDQIQVKLKMALILIEKKMFDRAIIKLEEILAVAPESDKVRFYLSAVHEEMRDFKSALKQYLMVEKDSSFFEEARLHASHITKMFGSVDDSIKLLNEVIVHKADSPQTYFYMSQLYEDKKDMSNAMKTLKDAEKKFVDSPQVHYHIGMLQDKLNQKDEMIESMKKVVDLQPDHSQALNYLAYSWAEQGVHLEKAESYARKAVLKEQDDAYILDTLGWVLFKKGDYKKAAEVLQKAHEMQPQVSIISEHLGDVYNKMNQPDKARALFLKASESEEDAARKKEIQIKLTQVENKIKDVRKPSSLGFGSSRTASP